MATTRPFSPSFAVKIAATATPSTAIQLPVDPAVLRLMNRGPNPVYVSLVDDAAALAAIPGASFTPAYTVSVAVGDSINIAIGALRFLSTICEATETATLIVNAGDGGI